MELVKNLMLIRLKNLTFGGKLVGDDLFRQEIRKANIFHLRYKGWKLKSKSPGEKQAFEIYLHTGQYENQADWVSALDALFQNTRIREANSPQ